MPPFTVASLQTIMHCRPETRPIAVMIPAPGEKPGDWWAGTGYRPAEGLSEEQQFYNGVPAGIVAEAAKHVREQVSAEGAEPWPPAVWPENTCALG